MTEADRQNPIYINICLFGCHSFSWIRAYHLRNNDGFHDRHRRLHDGIIVFTPLLHYIMEKTPGAELIIEYTRRELDGEGFREDIREVLSARSIFKGRQ